MKDRAIKEFEKARRIMRWQSFAIWSFCVRDRLELEVHISTIFLN